MDEEKIEEKLVLSATLINGAIDIKVGTGSASLLCLALKLLNLRVEDVIVAQQMEVEAKGRGVITQVPASILNKIRS